MTDQFVMLPIGNVTQAAETILWLTQSQGVYVVSASVETLALLQAFVNDVIATAPSGVDVDARVVHCAVCDVGREGVGLWDDYKEAWEGYGKDWSKALRATASARTIAQVLEMGADSYVIDSGRLGFK